MKKLLSFLLPLILLSFAITLVNCGDSSKRVPTTLTFAYLTEAAAPAAASSTGTFQPVVGTISGTTFTGNPVKDAGTGNPLIGNFFSVAMSPDGKKAWWTCLAKFTLE